ncbi:hypothetical protein SynBIOSE41_02340 [Synechococcus sp. BIOS-E4-1]|uniref:hypothetical protein n=1 Tax=Synechococcus sp. BIOS-E4-1 TaxID=1400864 RepID=UPI001644A2FD|nr:hypothetical protein [Synechococcus sp. BIOS-E4-1]QNI54840.1 hypothetical protein SynBIOSE41_02340 [Synechococcus sp. BIOS-E4-1]
MTGNDYGGFVERTPLSERLSVEPGTKKAKTAIQRPRREGIKGGLTALQVNYQKPVKRKRKGQPDNLTEGYEEGSEGYETWLEEHEQPGIEGLTGEEKHFLSMLNNDELTDNFF